MFETTDFANAIVHDRSRQYLAEADNHRVRRQLRRWRRKAARTPGG